MRTFYCFLSLFFLVVMVNLSYSGDRSILKYDQCKMENISPSTSKICDKYVGKILYGNNTRIDFLWEKGEVLGFIYKKKGALLSLDGDTSYLATYTGLHVIYKGKGSEEIYLTSHYGDSTIKHIYE
jgi:hypothetical protein